MRYRRPLALGSLVALVGVSLLAAGCGGGGSPGSGVASLGPTTTAPAAAAAATGGSSPGGELAQYASCMRSHGVSSFPDAASFVSSSAIKAAKGQMAQISESEASSSSYQAAQRACAKYDGSPATPLAHPSSQEMQKLLAVSHCMRAHGILSFPDPNPTTGELTAPTGISRDSPQVLAALRACRSLAEAAGLGPPHVGS